MKSDFTAGLKAPKSDKNLPKYMTLQELHKLFTNLEQDPRPQRIRNELMIKLLATTGMRRQELVYLIWEQVILDNQTILVRGKRKKERLLPLHPMVSPLFQDYKETILEQQKHYICRGDKEIRIGRPVELNYAAMVSSLIARISERIPFINRFS